MGCLMSHVVGGKSELIPAGLRYHTLDLHIHTPASRCFADKTVTAKQIVDAAVAAGLDGIAVTDHNSADFIDKVQTAAKGTGLRVFPGVEVTAKGGKDGIHVLAIFDPGADNSKVQDLLSRVHITPEQHGADAAIADDVCSVIKEIGNSGAIAILAHANSSKGVMCDMQGQHRTQVFREDALLAVEVTDGDFSDEKRAKNKRAVDLLNGSDANYANRKLAVIQGSDCSTPGEEGHSLAGIGRRHTCIKSGDPLDLECLRQAFIDPDARVRVVPLHGEALPVAAQPRIVAISVEGGFLDELDLSFHPGMNSIIGGKGSGKSLLVELMRFVLDAEPTQPEIRSDHLGKLERRLERFGQVALVVVDETGTTRSLKRMFDPFGENPYEDDDQALTAADFPALFLSQNEIIRIAESDEQQLDFIDRFFDFRTHQRAISQLGEELLKLDQGLADALRATHERAALLLQASVLDKRMTQLDIQLKNDVFVSYAKATRKAATLKSIASAAKELLGILDDAHEAVGLTLNPSVEDALASDPAVKRGLTALEAVRAEALGQTTATMDSLTAHSSPIDDEVSKFSAVLKSEEAKYQAMVAAAGGDYKALSTKRASLASDRTNLQGQIDRASAVADKLRPVAEARAQKLNELNEAQKSYSLARQAKCHDIQQFSAGRLTITVREATDASEFMHQLGTMKKGSYLRDEEIEKIIDSVSAHDFVAALLNYDIGDANKKTRLVEQLATSIGVPADRMKQLVDHLLQSRTYEDLLALQHQAAAQDHPDIRVRVADGNYEPLSAVSTGQKCTALLVMALAQGTAPVVIDQPEDSLDIKSIWDDMCTKLRSGKESRQFIFTTHNSSLAVASDTDCFIVLEADALSGRVTNSGAIDAESVKTEVIDYLEGGVKTYGVKYRKYDMGKRING